MLKSLAIILIIGLAQTAIASAQRGGSRKTIDDRSTAEHEVLRRALELVRVERRGGEGEGVARKGMERLVAENAKSPVLPVLRELLAGMRERRARTVFKVAMFYRYERCNLRAAESRLQEVVGTYPEYSRLDDVLYELAMLQSEAGRVDEAKVTLMKIVTAQRWFPRAREARSLLERLSNQRTSMPATTPN